MSKELVRSTAGNYALSRSDSQVTKDIGKVMMIGGGGGIVALGVMSLVPFLPVLLIILFLGGLITYGRGSAKS